MIKRPNVFFDETGSTAIEYALIAALIAISAGIALQALGEKNAENYTYLSNSVQEAGSASRQN